jgi:hypothetical protein
MQMAALLVDSLESPYRLAPDTPGLTRKRTVRCEALILVIPPARSRRASLRPPRQLQ